MATSHAPTVTDYIMPLLMNGLQGRMLHVPAPRRKKRELLLIYGQHASLEYWWPLALELNRYGAVTMPDLPGFGGMQSFYKIHEKPTLDNLADYLAAFVKLRYRSKRFMLVGVGYGFVVVTRMLQRYPDLAKKVDVVISLGGLARYDDIIYSRSKRLLYRMGGRLLATAPAAFWVRQLCLHPLSLKWWYRRRKQSPLFATEQTSLWRRNNLRTHFMTSVSLLKFDNCKTQVRRPLWHVSMRANHKLDHQRCRQHLQVAYQHVEEVRSRIRSQSLGTITYNRQTTRLLPAKLQRALSQL